MRDISLFQSLARVLDGDRHHSQMPRKGVSPQGSTRSSRVASQRFRYEQSCIIWVSVRPWGETRRRLRP
jgi:hypothetical protein